MAEASPDWTDLAHNRAGSAARAQAERLRSDSPLRTALARVLGLCTNERLTRDGYFGHAAADIAWQVVAATFAASCYVTWRRSGGIATPACGVAAALVGCCTFVALARPFAHQLPLSPFVDAADWSAGRVLWLGIVGRAGVLALAAARLVRVSHR
ncbi:hypothetical protein [Segeticoccus rhizosphaerae]|uniref:hypothetical protein n=1 Tax=Segeticoccus rhizosphaerae TaxID=1104777 RepID=UPI0010C00309|nr:hypothetical protein [Ornithinicoccus soli]